MADILSVREPYLSTRELRDFTLDYISILVPQSQGVSLDTSLVDDLVKHVHTRGFFRQVGVKEVKPGMPYS